jgi:hypothetical protein
MGRRIPDAYMGRRTSVNLGIMLVSLFEAFCPMGLRADATAVADSPPVALTADNAAITADSTVITADATTYDPDELI